MIPIYHVLVEQEDFRIRFLFVCLCVCLPHIDFNTDNKKCISGVKRMEFFFTNMSEGWVVVGDLMGVRSSGAEGYRE